MFKQFLALAMVLLLVGCQQQSALVTSLDAVQYACDAARVAIPLLVAAGTIDPATASLAMTFTGATAQATSQAIPEAESSDSSALKAEKIIAIYSQVLAQVPGLPTNAQALVQAIVAAIQAVVQQLQVMDKHPELLSKSWPLTRGDKAKLHNIQFRAAKLHTFAAVYKPLK